MAVAVAVVDVDYSGRKRVVADLTFSGTYTTNGEAPTVGFLKALGLSSKVLKCNPDAGGAATLGKVLQYDYAANKMKLFRADQIDDFLEEVPNATAIADTIRCEFVGI
jgi:hypothetical protein